MPEDDEIYFSCTGDLYVLFGCLGIDFAVPFICRGITLLPFPWIQMSLISMRTTMNTT
jgi:hypothetical protein